MPPSSPFPEKLHPVIDLISNGYGLNGTAASLLVADAVATAVGNSIRIRTTDYRDQPLGLNLAFVASGGGLVRSALLGLLEPICQQVDAAAVARRHQGIPSTQAALEGFIAELNQIEEGIRASEDELRAIETYFENVDAAVEKDVPPPIHPDYGFQTVSRRRELREAIEFGEQRTLELNSLIENRRLGLGPLIIADDCPWQDLPGAGALSFDGFVTHLHFAPHRFTSLMRLSQREIGAISELYRQTAGGTSSVSSGSDLSPAIVGTWAGDEHSIASLLRSRSISSSGLMSDFLICEADRDCADPDPDAILEFKSDDVWRGFINSIFGVRLSQAGRVLLMDAGSFRECLSFRSWCRAWVSELPAGIKPFFESWPSLVLRLAVIIAVMDGKVEDDVLAAWYVTVAADWLKAQAQSQVELLNRLIDADAPESALDRGVARIMQRLRNRGPRTLRDLVRTFDDQNYGAIGVWVEEAVRRGVVEKRDSYFFAASVSGSVSGRHQEEIAT